MLTFKLSRTGRMSPWKVGALSLAILLALVTQRAGANELTRTELEAQLSGAAFSSSHLERLVHMSFFEDRRVLVDGPLGAWEGTWGMVDTEFCIFFDSGPKAGTHCTQFVSPHDGKLVSAEGFVLTRVASAQALN